MKITYEIVGVPEAAERLEQSYTRLYVATAKEMGVQMLELRNYAVTAKMHGQMVNQRTGNLARNVISETEEQGSAVLGRVGIPSANTAPYGRILHDGGTTRAHVIEAKKAKALSFVMTAETLDAAGFGWEGGRIFLRRINHPGSKFPPRPYLASALEDRRAAIRASLAAAMEKAL